MNYELVDWEDIKRDCQYDHDNDGLIFGIHWLDENGNVIDAEWFSSNNSRELHLPWHNIKNLYNKHIEIN